VNEPEDLVCREVVEVVSEYLDGGMSPQDRARFERHLRECPYCAIYVDQMRAAIAALGRLPEDPLSPERRRQLVAAFRDWRAEPADAGGREP
jgi:anti-sigma factor RsiW